MKAADILTTAAGLVSGERAKQHGPMVKCHAAIAALWTAYLGNRRHPEDPLTALDASQMLLLMKVARVQTSEVLHEDHFLDQSGYAGCSGEIAAALEAEEAAHC